MGVTRGGREWRAGRWVRIASPGICVHGVGTTPGLWCSACDRGPRVVKVFAVGAAITRELQTETYVHVARGDVVVVTGETPLPHGTYPELRRAALRLSFETADNGVDPRFSAWRIDELMRRDDGDACTAL